MLNRIIWAGFDAYKWFYRINIFPLFHVHIKPSWDWEKASIRIIKHDTLIEEKLVEFKSLSKELTGSKYFQEVLNRREGIRFIIFEVPATNEFAQFDLDGDEMVLDFPIHEDSPHAKQKDKLVDLLKSYKFMKTKRSKKLYPLCWSISKSDYPIIRANFGGNTKLAAEFTLKIFKQIYKASPDNLIQKAL